MQHNDSHVLRIRIPWPSLKLQITEVPNCNEPHKYSVYACVCTLDLLNTAVSELTKPALFYSHLETLMVPIFPGTNWRAVTSSTVEYHTRFVNDCIITLAIIVSIEEVGIRRQGKVRRV